MIEYIIRKDFNPELTVSLFHLIDWITHNLFHRIYFIESAATRVHATKGKQKLVGQSEPELNHTTETIAQKALNGKPNLQIQVDKHSIGIGDSPINSPRLSPSKLSSGLSTPRSPNTRARQQYNTSVGTDNRRIFDESTKTDESLMPQPIVLPAPPPQMIPIPVPFPIPFDLTPPKAPQADASSQAAETKKPKAKIPPPPRKPEVNPIGTQTNPLPPAPAPPPKPLFQNAELQTDRGSTRSRSSKRGPDPSSLPDVGRYWITVNVSEMSLTELEENGSQRSSVIRGNRKESNAEGGPKVRHVYDTYADEVKQLIRCKIEQLQTRPTDDDGSSDSDEEKTHPVRYPTEKRHWSS